jgi:nucleotide-binding universal stress UspA family protein
MAVGRIVVGVDGSENSIEALRWAIDEARRMDATIDAVMAWSLPWYSSLSDPLMAGAAPFDPAGMQRDVELALERAVTTACRGRRDLPVIERIAIEDRPAHALLETAKGADLLVVGARGAGGFAGLLLGSVSTQCVNHATCPVAVIRSPGRA